MIWAIPKKMTPIQTLKIRAGEIRQRLAAIGGMADLTDEIRSELETLKAEYTDNDSRQAALKIAGDVPAEPVETRQDGEGKELRELRQNVNFERYIAAAMAGGGVHNGAELEYNQHLGIAANYFPMEMLAPKPLETRAARDGDAMASQASWLDRVMAGTAAERLGVSFRTVAPGVANFPATTAGGSPIQRGRTEAVTESTYTVAVTEIKPSRAAVNGKYSIEDDLRLPGMADAIERDMRAAMAEDVDRTIFVGDSGANEANADIDGFNTYTSVGEAQITQSNKVKADETLKVFLAQLDGIYAASLADLRIVASKGANTLWFSTIHAAAVDNQTVAQFLMASGLAWTMRGSLEDNTANGDFGAFMGLARGIEGAAIAAVWDAGQLVRDPFTNAKTGEVELTLNYLWNFKVVRTNNFKRLKFVT